MCKTDKIRYHKRNLPHYQPDQSIIAVTFRLNFSFSNNLLSSINEYKNEYNRICNSLSGKELLNYKKEFGKIYYERYDELISMCQNSIKWLEIDDIATIVKDSLHFLDKKKYDLIAFCIMPNHVHLIFKPLLKNESEPFDISNIMHSIKRFSAIKCNKILNNNKPFWHKEYYDHFIRDTEDFYNQLHYLINNPVKSNLTSHWKKWKYTYLNPEYEVLFTD